MNEVQERYKVSTGRVAVGGFSIGGMLALDAGLRYKGNDGERPGGVMGFSTAMINDESGDPVEYQEALSLAAKDELPFYVAHGANDPMIPPRLGRATRDSLVKAGVPVEFFSFSGFHEIKPEVVVSARQFLNKIFS
jgi:phospholipase/carboxylesterase